ncbi:MAG TPA: hypothetical protein VNC60_06485 [Actinomycetota bacterium]|nr:hypothetical protein [Actinomycetota bacterium]
MSDPASTCQRVDVALSLQQMIRDRETAPGSFPTTVAIGEACGKPSIGSVETDGVRHRFCSDHVLEERISR